MIINRTSEFKRTKKLKHKYYNIEKLSRVNKVIFKLV